jgi:hypothetical protein
VRERFKSIGVTVTPPSRRSPLYLTQFVVSELERWGKVVKAAGIAAD